MIRMMCLRRLSSDFWVAAQLGEIEKSLVQRRPCRESSDLEESPAGLIQITKAEVGSLGLVAVQIMTFLFPRWRQTTNLDLDSSEWEAKGTWVPVLRRAL